MYDFFERGAVNLDISNKCTLQCPGCVRQSSFINLGTDIPGHYMTQREWKMYLNHFNRFDFCGQVSDPTMHPLLPQFLDDIYRAGKKASVHVAASHKPIEFFKKCFEAHPAAQWFFGIDGLPEDSHKYRINQDGVKLFNLMKIHTKYVGETVWQYIIANYNENDIDKAQDICDKLGIRLYLISSDRFNKKQSEFTPSQEAQKRGNYSG